MKNKDAVVIKVKTAGWQMYTNGKQLRHKQKRQVSKRIRKYGENKDIDATTEDNSV